MPNADFKVKVLGEGNKIFRNRKFRFDVHHILMFPTRRDSATFRDEGTEVLSLSQDKGTTGQAQNIAIRRDTGRDNHNISGKIWDGMWDKM